MSTPSKPTKQRRDQRSWGSYADYDANFTGSESTTLVTVQKAVNEDSNMRQTDTVEGFQERTTGDALRILDLPDNFTVGLDMMTMTTTKSLQGFCRVPPGAHFLWVQQPGAPFRSGYWFMTKYRRGEFRIKKWDKFNEVLADPTPKEKEAVDRRFEKLAPFTLDGLMNNKTRSAGPAVPDYSFAPNDSLPPLWSRDPASLWATLTDNIVPASLSRVTSQPLGHDFHVDSTTDHSQNPPSEVGKETTTDRSSQFNFVIKPEMWGRLSHEEKRGKDPEKIWAESMATRHITPYGTGLWQLWLGGNEPDETQMREMLSDLQFTFLTGTLLSNLACLEQWWNLVLKAVLKSWSLAEQRPEFVSEMITILHAQLYFTEVYLEGDNTPGSDGGSGSGKGKSTMEAGPNPDRVLYQVKRGNRDKLKKALESYRKEIETRARQQHGQHVAEVRKTFEELECFLFGLGWDLRGWGSVHGKENDGKGSSSEDEDGNEDMDWNSEDDDDEPVIVELDEEGREVGLVSFND